MKFQEKLISLRKSYGLTQEQLAEKLNVSRQAVSRWESEESSPDMYNLSAICKCFGVSSDYLINDDCTNDEDTPIARKKNDEISSVKEKRRMLHLISGICFVIAWACSVYGIINAEIGVQLWLSAVTCMLTAISAIFQFVCFFRK